MVGVVGARVARLMLRQLTPLERQHPHDAPASQPPSWAHCGNALATVGWLSLNPGWRQSDTVLVMDFDDRGA